MGEIWSFRFIYETDQLLHPGAIVKPILVRHSLIQLRHSLVRIDHFHEADGMQQTHLESFGCFFKKAQFGCVADVNRQGQAGINPVTDPSSIGVVESLLHVQIIGIGIVSEADVCRSVAHAPEKPRQMQKGILS